MKTFIKKLTEPSWSNSKNQMTFGRADPFHWNEDTHAPQVSLYINHIQSDPFGLFWPVNKQTNARLCLLTLFAIFVHLFVVTVSIAAGLAISVTIALTSAAQQVNRTVFPWHVSSISPRWPLICILSATKNLVCTLKLFRFNIETHLMLIPKLHFQRTFKVDLNGFRQASWPMNSKANLVIQSYHSNPHPNW